MMHIWIAALASGALAWWLTGQLAYGRLVPAILDRPNERSLHAKPTPRIGGIGILAGLLFGLILAEWLGFSLGGSDGTTLFGSSLAWGIVLLTYGLALVSFIDDRGGIPVPIRLATHLAAASALVIGGGLELPALSFPLVGVVDLGWFSVPVSIGFLVWMTNLYNFMDGMDGFAGGMAVAGGIALAGFGWGMGHTVLFLVGGGVAVSSVGFLLHNFPPAKIFMGDVGSVPLGFLFGSLMLLGVRDGVFDGWVPIMLFSPFIVDATVTLLRRLVRGERIWQAHRTHYYQRLVLLGWGHTQTVLAEYGLMAVCGALAWGFQMADERMRCVLLGCWGLLMVAAMAGVHLAERRVARSKVKA
ncbi:MAG: glycosyltransferase family 4 protein [Nitrospira sp.]|nr:glycosyltransferase family 4 protein [Nitrospira sp.]